MNSVKDIHAAYDFPGGTRRARILHCIRSPGIQAVMTYRMGNWLLGKSLILRVFLEPLYLLLYHRMRSKWGIEIGRKATIGEGLVVPHHGGIFIGGSATIGKNVVVFQDVTIGLAFDGPRAGAPAIGDNVIIGPGAKIAGKISIGSNVRIGPNTVVLRNVPDGAVVLPAAMKMVVMNPQDNEENEQ